MDLVKIEEQLKQVPEEVKKIFFSIETAKKIQEIGEENGLLLDQIDDLIEETGLTIIGLHATNKFVSTIATKLNIKQEIAKKITDEINDGVLMQVKKDSQLTTKDVENANIVEPTENKTFTSPLSSLERVGGFSVEKETVEPEKSDVTEADRGEILAGLENPQPRIATPGGNAPLNLPTDERSKSMPGAMAVAQDNHTEPLVDYLLSKPAGQSTQKVSAQPASNPSNKAPAAPKRSGPDPYREPVK